MSDLKGCDHCGAHNDTPGYGQKAGENRLTIMVILENALRVFCNKYCMEKWVAYHD